MGGSEEEAVRWDLIHEESNALCGPIAGSRHCKECEVKERRVVDRKKALKKLMSVTETEHSQNKVKELIAHI